MIIITKTVVMKIKLKCLLSLVVNCLGFSICNDQGKQATTHTSLTPATILICKMLGTYWLQIIKIVSIPWVILSGKALKLQVKGYWYGCSDDSCHKRIILSKFLKITMFIVLNFNKEQFKWLYKYVILLKHDIVPYCMCYTV